MATLCIWEIFCTVRCCLLVNLSIKPKGTTSKNVNFSVETFNSDLINSITSDKSATPSSVFTIPRLNAHFEIEPSVSLILFPSLASNLSYEIDSRPRLKVCFVWRKQFIVVILRGDQMISSVNL